MAENDKPIPLAQMAQSYGPQPLPMISETQADDARKGIFNRAAMMGPQSPVQRIPGDELMRQNREARTLGPDEKKEVELFKDSFETLTGAMEQDPNYANHVISKIHGKQGYDLARATVDLVDDEKLAILKESHPELFTGFKAAATAFANSNTFGQLSRLQAGMGALAGVQPVGSENADLGERYDGLLRQSAEWARLLQKAYPKEDVTGTLASFLLPGPMKWAFEGMAKLGGAGMSKVLEKVVSRPDILRSGMGPAFAPSLLARTATGAAGGALAGGTIEGGMGAVGSGEESFSLDRAATKGAAGAIGGGLFGGLIPPLAHYFPLQTVGGTLGAIGGTAVGQPIPGMVAGAAAGQLLSSAAKRNSALPGFLAEASGSNLQSLRRFNERGDQMMESYGPHVKDDNAREFYKFLFSDPIKKLPEKIEADSLLQQLPKVNAQPLLDFLGKKIPNPDKEDRAMMVDMADRLMWVQGQIKMAGGNAKQVPADAMREITEKMQSWGDQYYQKAEIPPWAQMYHDGAAMGRKAIMETAAKEGGEVGQRYNELMLRAWDKRKALDLVTSKFGNNTAVWPERIRTFMDTIMGPNKGIQRGYVEKIDEYWSTSFLDKWDDAYHANNLGPNGPQVMSQVKTGAYSKPGTLGGSVGGTIGTAVGGGIGYATGHPVAGATIGGVVGGAAGRTAGNVISSPKVSAMLIGTSDNISGVYEKLMGNPELLNGVMNNRAAPTQVRQMARMIGETLSKEGPQSAGSLMRVMADTPLFFGLVHFLDKSRLALSEGNLRRGLEKTEANEGRVPQGAPETQQFRPQQGKFY